MSFVPRTAREDARLDHRASQAGAARLAANIPATSEGPAAPADLIILAQAAGRPDLAEELVVQRMTLQAARARLSAEGAPVPSPAPAEPADAVPEADDTAPSAEAPQEAAAAATEQPETAAAHAPATPPASEQPRSVDAKAIYAHHRALAAARAGQQPSAPTTPTPRQASPATAPTIATRVNSAEIYARHRAQRAA